MKETGDGITVQIPPPDGAASPITARFDRMTPPSVRNGGGPSVVCARWPPPGPPRFVVAAVLPPPSGDATEPLVVEHGRRLACFGAEAHLIAADIDPLDVDPAPAS